MAPRSARSFRQEFNMQDLTTEQTYTTHYTTEKYVRTSHSTELDGQPVKSMTNGKLNSPNYTTKTIITEDDRPDVRNLKRVHRMYEGPNIIESKGILHPETKEILTVGQAISMRILDVRTGRLLSAPGTRQTISIEQAAKEGLIDPKLAARLTGPCGMTEDGNEVTLIEAIQRELYDAEQGLTDPAEKRVKVTVEGEKSAQGMSISDALNRGQVDLQRGLYRLPNGSYITIAEAYQRGYLIYNEIIKIKSSALCLSDAISQELVDNSGWILDRNSGDRYQIDVAIKNELINPNIREVVDPKNDTKITLAEAIEKNIINTKHSKYVHNITKEKLTFKDAASKRFICIPMTLKDVCDNNLMTNDGKILSPANRSPLNILEAISAGVLDSDNVKCITNTTTGGLLTLSEALGAKIILHDNKFRDNLTGEICTIPEAVDRGLITSVSQRSIFDIDGFKDPKTGEFVSFNVALGKGNLKYVNGETFLKSESGDWVFLEDCTKVSLVRAEVLEMFNRKIGIYENGKELSVLDAVFKNILDPKTGHLLEAATKKPIPFNKAVEINMITPEGAALLNSLLNITLTLQTVTKTVKRYVTVTNTSATQRSETIITFAEAIRRGLIDENTQTFTDPTTGTVFPIQQALDEGLLGVEKNEPRVVHISDRVKKDLVPGQVVELKITKKSFIKDLPPSPEGKVQRDSARPETLKSPDFAIHETVQPREGLVQEIRTVTSKSVVTEPSVTSMTIKKNTIELPRGGWTLKEAIQQNLFDPSTGMFVIPGTDRVLDLEEAIKLNIINGDSANVVDPKSKKEIPLNRALDFRIIDSTGHYKHKTEIMTMKQAIERRYIVFIQLTSTTHSQKVITITSVAGMPDKMEISEMCDAPSHEIITEDQSALEPVQVKPGVIFDPATALVISTSSGVSENVLEAVDRGLLPANSVKVVEPQSGRPISLKQAVEQGIVDPKTGEYKDKTGKRISLVDAAKIGLVAVVGAPLVAASKVIQVVKSTMVVDPQTGENIPMEVAYERGLVDPVTYKKYEESIRDRSPEVEVTQEIKTTSTSSVTYSQVTTTKTLPTETTVTVVVDPKTGEKLPIEVAYERGLIDPISYKKYELSIRERTPEYAQRFTTPSSDITFTQVPSATTPDKVVTMVVDPKTGEQLPIEVAYERGILDPITYKIYQDSLAINQQETLTKPGIAQTAPGASTVTISQVTKPVSVGAAVSEGFITVESIQNSLSADNRRIIETNVITEKLKSKPTDIIQINKTTISAKPKYKVNVGREQTPEGQVLDTKPIVLQKLRKHVVTPGEAVEQGLIDKDTVKILEAVKVYKDESGSPITLEVAIEKGIVDENQGKIVDPVRGDVLNIKEAIKRGILDVEGQDEILIPLAKSLSIPEVLEQGLLDPVTGKIVHPETGNLLTLREAIICDIIDPLSSITIAPGKNITLAEAIERNIVDHDKNVFKTSDGPLDFISAVNAQVFPESENKPVIDIPPAAMTLNIAIKKNLINPHTGEMKHPLTGEMTPVGDAIKKDLIMAIPYPQTSETLTLEEALDKGAVNLKQATFTDPKTKQVLPLDKALEQGLVAVKPITDMQTTGVVTTITETFTSQHTVTTKMIELLADYVLISSNQVQNTKTGEIISIDEARRHGIVRDEQTSKEQFITDTNINFEDALNLGYINIEAGTFTHPKTGETVTISEAVTSGLLNTEVPTDSGKSSPQKQILDMLDLNEAFELLFDEKTQKFRDPKSPNKVMTFKEALEKKVINPDSVIYNVEAGKPVTLKEALNTGLIDKKTGKVKEPKTGKSVDIKNAAKMGLIAVVAAPVLAGMAVVQGAKSVTSKIMQPKQEKAVESPNRISTSEKTTRYEPDEDDKDKKPTSKDKNLVPKDVLQPGKQEEKLQTSQPIWKEPKPLPPTSKTVVAENKTAVDAEEPSRKVSEKYNVKKEISVRQDPIRDEPTREIVIDKKTVIIKETSPNDVSSFEPNDVLKANKIEDRKPELLGSKTVVTETTTVHEEVSEKPNQAALRDLDVEYKQVVERPSPIKDMEHVVFEEKPAVEEFIETIVEGGKVITVTKAVVTKTASDIPEGISSKESNVQSPKEKPEKQNKEKTPTTESKTVVQEMRTVVTTAGTEKILEKPGDKLTSQTTTQKPEDLVPKYDAFTKFDDGPTVQEIHEVTPDGKEITRIVTTTSKTEPSEFLTEHSSTVITSSTSTLTTVEITQNQSTSYQVITEEVSGPKDFTETVIQEYQVTEAPDETDDIQITKQYTVSRDSEVPEVLTLGKPDELQRDPNEKPEKGKDQFAAKNKTPEFSERKELEPEKPLEVAPGVVYDPNTSVVISAKEGVAENLLEAVNKGIVPVDTVKVVEPKTGKEITLKEAITKGIVDSKTGEVKDKSGKKISIADAAKIGLIAVVGAPILDAAKVVQVVKSAVVVDPKTGEKLPLDQARERGLVDADTYKKYEEMIKTQTPEEIATEVLEKTKHPAGVTFTEQIVGNYTTTSTTTTPGEIVITTTTEYTKPIASEITTTTVEQKVIDFSKTAPINVNDGKSISAMLIDAERQPLRVIDEITEQNVTKEKAEPLKPLYENIQLIDAIAQGKIEPKVCRIIINGVESPLTVQDSLEQEQISRFAPVDVLSKNCVVVREVKPNYTVAISQRITPEELSEMGVYDIEKQIFLHPETGAKITFEELVYGLQIFDPESILVKDLSSKSDDYITFDEAIARPIIDKTTGHMVNPKTGKRVPFLECIQLGWIVEKPEDVTVPEQVTIESALEQGLYNPKTGEIKDVNTGALVPIGKAIENGLVDQESLLIKVPRTNEIITLSDAIERNIVEIHEGVITIIETQETIEITVAIQRGLLTVIRKPISIVAVIDNDMYEPKSGKIKDKVTEQLVTVGDAVDRNIVHPTISEIKDTASEKFISLSEALDTKLIDPETGKIRDKKTGKDIPLDDALKKGLVATKAVTFSLFDVIELGYYSPESGKIMNPKTGQLITLGEAIKDNLVDPSDVKIKDDKSEAVVPFDKAVKSGLIDLEKGVITSPLCNLKDACDKGYLLSDKKPWTLQEGLVQGFYDPETGLLTINDVTMTLEDAIKIGNINPEALTVRNSITGEIISLADAIKAGIIDSKEGKVRDPIHGDKISLTDASERGLIVPAKRKLSLPEAVFKGFYDPKTGKFSNPLSKEKIPTDRAIKKRLIDPQSTLVHAAGKVIPFEFAVDRGIIDSRTGTIRLGDENIDFREAFERGILVEVRKPMSLIEALEKGVYNEITGLFMDPQSGKKYTLVEAIKLNLIDAQSVHILDNRLGKWDKITLPESLETGVIDDQTGKIRNINNDNEEISLRKAFEIGLLVDSKAPISLQRALHQGLYDDSTGKIIDPATNRKITLHEALRRSIISPKYLCYFDKKSEKPLSLGDCCRSEIIDRRSGKFHEPGSDVQVSLSEAMSLGLIVDIESAGFTLYEALAMNMYSITELAFIHPVSDRPISLKTAITEEFINPETSLVKHIPSSKYIKLSEAISSGIVDDENSIYILPNGNQINLLDAKHRGLIVTTKKNLSLEEIIRNGLFRADNGKIVDPSTNEFVDINKAIETKLLNPDLTVVKDNFTNKFKPLPVAIQQGDVDISKGRVIDTKAKKTYSLDIAFDKGLLVTVIQPITSQMLIKKYVTDSAASKEPILREFTLDEAIKYEFIDPATAVIKDPHKNKYIPLKLGITEGIIDKNAKGSFDTQNRSQTLCFVFENGLIVYVREPVTFEQAIENGHLNVATARFTDPQSKEVLTIRDAATLGYIDPDTALIKDNLKKRLVKLPEAFRKGLMDAEKGNILDTETSKLNTLTAAIESGLLMTPKKSFTLIETLNFGIYNPTTGALNDPFITTSVMDRKRLNLGEAIAQGIVDPSSTVVKEPETGKICPLVQAIEQKLVDPVEGRLTIDPVKSISLDLVKALKKGYLLPAETRPLPAMLKNPFELNRECLPVRDHINDDIKNHHRFAKYLTSHSHCAKNFEVAMQAVEEKYRLCDETLSKLLEWIAVVEERLANQEAVKEDMDELRNQINILKLIKDDLESHQRQVSACADQAKQLLVSGGDVLAPHELQISNELNTFNTWMEGAYRTLEEKEAALSKLNSLPDQSEDVREFVSDVIAHQADLRFITMSAQKFVDESKEFLSILNEYRTSLPSRLSHVPSRGESSVRDDATRARRRHAELGARAQRLHDWLRAAADGTRHYHDALQRATKWINEACEQLVKSLEGNLTPSEIRQLEVPVLDLTSRYKDITDAVGSRCSELEAALLQSQQKPASLIRERLDEQIREQRIAIGELEARRPTLAKLLASARQAALTPSNARIAKKLEQRAEDIYARYEKLVEKSSKRSEFLEEVSSELAQFSSQAGALDAAHAQLLEQADTRELARMPAEELGGRLAHLASYRDKQMPLLEECLRNGKQLISKKDVTDTHVIRDRMKALENQWRDFNATLEEKQKLSKQRADQLNQYESLKIQSMESRVTRLQPVAVDLEVIKQQQDELRPLAKEYRDFSITIDKEEADKTIKQARAVLEEMYEKQSILDSTKTQVRELLKRKQSVLGADRLHDEMEDVASRWKALHDAFKDKIRLMEEMKDFHDTYSNLSVWLSAKDRMMAALGPISSDSRMVQVLREEFRVQQPQLSHLQEVGGAALARLDPASHDATKLKHKVTELQDRWNDLLNKLEQRAESLGAAADTSREFDAGLSRLRDALQTISDKLDDVALENEPEEQLRKIENLERQLEGQRPLLADLEGAGAALAQVLSDPASRQDIQSKLSAVARQYDNLQRKLDHRKAEIEAALKDGRNLEENVARTLGWLQSELNSLPGRLQVSADATKLQQQLERHEPLYRELTQREHELIMLLDKGREMEKKPAHQGLRKELDRIQTQWDKLKRETVDRYTRLQTAKEHCRKFHKAQESFVPWLSDLEDRLAKLPAIAFTKKEVEKQLKELQQIRNDIWKRSGEYENNKTLGETFISSCDIDQEVVRKLLDSMKERWDRINNEVLQQVEYLESTARKLGEFAERVRGVEAPLARCEARLLAALAAPPARAAADKINPNYHLNKFPMESGILQTNHTKSTLSVTKIKLKLQQSINVAADDIVQLALECSGREAAGRARAVLDEQARALADRVKSLSHDLSDLEKELDGMKPPGRDIKTVKQQLDDIGRFYKRLENADDLVGDTERAAEELVDSGHTVDDTKTRDQVEGLRKQLAKLDERARAKEQDLDDTLSKLEAFYKAYDSAAEQVRSLKPVSSEVEQIRSQQKDFAELKRHTLEPLGQNVAHCNKIGQGLVRSALQGTNERERRLDVGLLQSGKFAEALAGLEKWLADTEDMFLKKMLMDRQNSMSSLFAMGNEVAGGCEPAERKAIEKQLKGLMHRYGALVEHSLNIGDLLEASRKGLRHLVLTYQDLSAWMDAMEQYLAKRKILPMHMEKLLRQMHELTEKSKEIASKQEAVDSTVESGLELMKHISGDEALQLKDKLDALQRRYNDLTSRGADLLRVASETLPLVEQLYNSHARLADWMAGAESCLQSVEPREEDILRLEAELQEYRPILENLNQIGPQLCQISPGEGATHIESIVTRDNRRFDAIAEQVQRKAERLLLSKKRSLEVVGDMEEVLEWLRGVDSALRNAEPPSCEAALVRAQLKEHRPISDDVAAQRVRVRDLLSQAKKVLRECQSSEETAVIRDRSEELKEIMEEVGQLAAERLAALEQALPLAEHFADTHYGLSSWLDDMEKQIQMLAMPALRPEQIVHQQDKNEMLQQSINNHKPLVDKLVKTGEALAKLCGDEDVPKVQDIVDADCERYNALRAELRQRQQELEQALQESSQFSDKLEGMLRALSGAADQLHRAEPVSAHPPKIEDQIEENNALVEDLEKRQEAYNAVQRAASDVISKANKSDPAVRDIRNKLDKLNNTDRGNSLDSTLEVARKFWQQLNAVMAQLSELEDTLTAQPPPAAQPRAIEAQQVALQEIRHEIDHTKPEVEKVRKTGSTLMSLCGEPDKPEVKKHMEDLDSAWDNITALYARREENLIDAMEKAMEFHDTLQNLLEFLDSAEDKFSRMGPLGSDIDAVKRQIAQLASFKQEVDPHMVKVEALNRQAQELTERTSSEQAAAIKAPLTEVNSRWSALLRGMVERQQQLERALLRLGQLQHALQELLTWIQNTGETLDTLRPVAGDPQILEVELAKLKVLVNDIAAHQASVDTLNDAGAQIVQQGTDEAGETAEKLATLNRKWRELQQKARDRQTELEDALREAQSFNAEIGDLLSWLSEVDSVIAASKPVGGLPETASEQLERFMEVYNEIEANRPKVEAVLQQGQEYLKKQDRPNPTSQLHHNLKNLKSRWDNVTARETMLHLDKKGTHLKYFSQKQDVILIKNLLVSVQHRWERVVSKAAERTRALDHGFKEAKEFNEMWNNLMNWLNDTEEQLDTLNAEATFKDAMSALLDWLKKQQKDLAGDSPVHGDLDTVMALIEQHKVHISSQVPREDAASIRQQCSELKSAWEAVLTLSERKAHRLEAALKEAEKLHRSVNMLLEWLSDAETKLRFSGQLPEGDVETQQQIRDHERFVRELNEKQRDKDDTISLAHSILSKAHPDAVTVIKHWITIIQSRWDEVWQWAMQRGGKLEAHMQSLKDLDLVLEELLQWLIGLENTLLSLESEPLPESIELLEGLIEDHKELMEHTQKRQNEVDRVCKAYQVKSQSQGRESTPRKVSAKSATKGAPGRVSPGRETPDRNLPHYGPRFPAKGRDNQKNQFLKFMNHKKSRLTDLFRKMDKDNNGLIARHEFIDGIINTSKYTLPYKPAMDIVTFFYTKIQVFIHGED
ncbi:hypothetical protein HF086_013784 [Spodoptera exigua]|uniref:EF-hand domain-containing protein n=1 Tax=Spodoptera exigua TaxID=7107 RepID=A0A922MAL4_SPOEX|nr:hypothetical protein HF086_013784 [Spodoptera exigua]